MATLKRNLEADPNIELWPSIRALNSAVFKILSGFSKIPGNAPGSVCRVGLCRRCGDEAISSEADNRAIAFLDGSDTACQEVPEKLSDEPLLISIDQLLRAIDVNDEDNA